MPLQSSSSRLSTTSDSSGFTSTSWSSQSLANPAGDSPGSSQSRSADWITTDVDHPSPSVSTKQSSCPSQSWSASSPATSTAPGKMSGSESSQSSGSREPSRSASGSGNGSAPPNAPTVPPAWPLSSTGEPAGGDIRYGSHAGLPDKVISEPCEVRLLVVKRAVSTEVMASSNRHQSTEPAARTGASTTSAVAVCPSKWLSVTTAPPTAAVHNAAPPLSDVDTPNDEWSTIMSPVAPRTATAPPCAFCAWLARNTLFCTVAAPVPIATAPPACWAKLSQNVSWRSTRPIEVAW